MSLIVWPHCPKWYVLSWWLLLGFFRKNPNKGGWGHTFWKKNRNFKFRSLPLEILTFLFYSWHFWTKQSFPLGNSKKMCYTPWKFQSQKPTPIEIPHDFFLITPGNYTSFLINPPGISTCCFQQAPGLSMFSPPAPPHLRFDFPGIVHYHCFTISIT